jgi:hypothetical protein
MEILYYYVNDEIKRQEIKNLTWDEVMQKRYDIFDCGFMAPVDPGHWIVISPGDIKRLDIFRQVGYIWEDFKK